jgi:hypothetical protein
MGLFDWESRKINRLWFIAAREGGVRKPLRNYRVRDIQKIYDLGGITDWPYEIVK